MGVVLTLQSEFASYGQEMGEIKKVLQPKKKMYKMLQVLISNW